MMNIDEMKPGNVMNVRVAEDVMGWNMVRRRTYEDVVSEDDYREAAFTDRWIWNTDKGCFSTRDWNPSYDIADAWRVLEALEYNWSLSRDVGQCGSDYETCGEKLYRFVYSAPGMPMQGTTASAAPLAICRGVLKAVED